MKSDPDMMKKLMDEYKEAFDAHDADKDGFLTEEEHKAITEYYEKKADEEGNWTTRGYELGAMYWQAMRLAYPEDPGISFAANMECAGIVMAKNEELKQAAGL